MSLFGSLFGGGNAWGEHERQQQSFFHPFEEARRAQAAEAHRRRVEQQLEFEKQKQKFEENQRKSIDFDNMKRAEKVEPKLLEDHDS